MTRFTIHSRAAFAVLVATTVCGCRSFSETGSSLTNVFAPQKSVENDPAPSGVVQVSAESDSTWDQVTKGTTRVANFVQGKEQENQDKATQLYQQADAEFKRASAMPREDAIDAFSAAAKLFQRAGEASPGSALEQDGLFMQGESLFFADRLTLATDTYQRLQKDFPRNKHNDRVAARLFAISRYWIDVEKANEDKWFTLNFFDKKRPTLDVDGHAIRVLDQIRYDDPTGRLADDATMAAAAEYIRQERYEDADEFLTDLRESFPDSEHLFLSHLLGIRCKMEIYSSAGAEYSAAMLDEADKLVTQTRQRFPDKLQDQQYAEMVARAAAEISFRQAEKLFTRAQLRDKQKYYASAAGYYQRILDKHGDTEFADSARERLVAISDLPASPAKRLTWLQNLFPSKRGNKPPLQATFQDSNTILR